MLQTGEYLLPGFISSILFLAVSEIINRIRKEGVTWFHRILILITGLYITEIFTVTLSPGSVIYIPPSFNNINLIPFKVLKTMVSNPLNFWGNILLFIPMGILLVLLFNHCQRLTTTLLIGAGMSFFIELLQLFGIRSTDIDDILLNTIGTLLGYSAGKILTAFIPSFRRNIGIFKKKDGKLTRKRRDAGSFAILAIFILISVFIKGYVIADRYSLPPAAPHEILLNATPSSTPSPSSTLSPSPQIRESKDLSVSVAAKNAYLWDITSNTVLYEKESSEEIAPASTTKMLTTLTVLDYCDENEKVSVGNEIQLIAKDASRAWLYPGAKMTIRQLFDALLLPSGNDAAYALAVFTGKKICHNDAVSTDKAIKTFIDAMNDKAIKIGAIHSNFLSPDGYDTDGQYTTSKDLALIANEFLKSDSLREIVNSHKISDRWINGQNVTYYNTNELINPESPYYYKFAKGLKTGSSSDAGNCLVSYAYINKTSYICVVMGSTKEGRWQDSIKLFNAITQ